MQFAPTKSAKASGFTLIELSIVLVIIGLLVGGILVGRDLISAAEVRAQISQIDKYNAAVHTFQLKFGYLPGDIPNPAATQCGFVSRGQYAGEGDGNGIIEGMNFDGPDTDAGYYEAGGETVMFWVDLSTANLIDASLHTGSPTATADITNIDPYFPKAKIGRGNYIYVYSGGWQLGGGIGPSAGDGQNYFGIAVPISVSGGDGGMWSNPGLTVLEAYSIDTKIDDGLPQSGNVLTLYETETLSWTPPGSYTSGGGPYTSATPWASTNCYDNNGVAGTQKYSLEKNGSSTNVNQVNCALSFRFR